MGERGKGERGENEKKKEGKEKKKKKKKKEVLQILYKLAVQGCSQPSLPRSPYVVALCVALDLR